MSGQIDAWAELLAEPVQRNYERWPEYRSRYGDYQGEVDHLKDWLQTRAEWIDSEFIERPTFSHPGGSVGLDFPVEISVPEGTIFYTLNGPDPRGPDQSPAAEAIEYTGPITITGNTRISARARVEGGVWSGMSGATFIAIETPLVVTEIMYNPKSLPGDNFGRSVHEFLEFYNAGNAPIDLRSIILEKPHFEFTDSPVTTLGPGQYVVLTRLTDAFLERYGSDGILIAGQYSGALSNSTQTIRVTGPVGEVLMDFDYQSAWEPSTDAQGHSLVIQSPESPPESWHDPASWRPSLEKEGSPGRGDDFLGRRLQGDLNANGFLEIADVTGFLFNLFGLITLAPCPMPEGNLALQDSDGDGVLTQNDALRVLRYLFLTGPPPANGVECAPIAGCSENCG